MGWVDDVQGGLVGLDTAPLIYYLEEHPTYLPIVDPFFDALARGDLQVVTSTVTLIEVLVQPLRRNDVALAARYRQILLATRGLAVRPLTPDIAEEAARLRAAHRLRTPDAIQRATALTSGAGTFLTNDADLPSLSAIRVLLVDDLRT